MNRYRWRIGTLARLGTVPSGPLGLRGVVIGSFARKCYWRPMPTLNEVLGTPPKRQQVVDDCCQVLDAEVADKGGLTGVAIKGAYGVVKGIKPGFVREVVDGLLDDFLRALDPLYQDALKSGVPAGAHLLANKDRMAEALLAVTDARAQRAERMMIKKAYDKLRPVAKKQVEAAAPRVSQLLDRHV